MLQRPQWWFFLSLLLPDRQGEGERKDDKQQRIASHIPNTHFNSTSGIAPPLLFLSAKIVRSPFFFYYFRRMHADRDTPLVGKIDRERKFGHNKE